MGLVHSKIMNYYEIQQPVYFAFFQISFLQKYLIKEIHYSPISTMQNISRDIAFTVAKSVKTRNLLEKIKETAKDFLKDVLVFDVYAGPNIAENLKSMAVRMVFNFGENVSKDKIQEILDQVINELEKSYQIVIRK
jgi:phenylalanyl-tRNA synthetase beta chain